MNTATAAAVGTSLEVLAPYLPYKIEVENIRQNGFTKQGTRHLLVGLDCTDDFPIKAGSMCYKPEGVLPVLRDFSQLTVPLPTGEVPAVEVAKLVGGTESEWSIKNYKRGSVLLQTTSGLLTYHLVIKCILRPNWGWHFFIKTWPGQRYIDPLNIGAAYDYLRSKHFALPVNGRPLVANVDYIPLTAPFTPTREADNNPTL